MSEVIILDGDALTRADFARALQKTDFTPVECDNGLDALREIFARRPAAVVMALRVPQFDGLELIRVLRAASDLPILVTSASGAPNEAVRVLDTGADDYIEKPVSPSELAARVRAAVRRYRSLTAQAAAEEEVVRTGPLIIDRAAQVVTKRGVSVQLTRTEAMVLDVLASRVGRLVSHRQLLSTVWGEQYINDTHYVRVYIGALRTKLEDKPAAPRLLVNEWGTGYRLAALPPDAERAPALTSDEAGERDRREDRSSERFAVA